MQSNSSSSRSDSEQAPNFRKVVVASLKQARYADKRRPLSWDQRRDGIDVITSQAGEDIRLWSDAGQSPPQAGWVILLTSEGERADKAHDGYRWTLYGLPAGAETLKD